MKPEPLKNKTHYCYEHEIYENEENVHPACRTEVFLKEDVALAVKWLLQRIERKKEKICSLVEKYVDEDVPHEIIKELKEECGYLDTEVNVLKSFAYVRAKLFGIYFGLEDILFNLFEGIEKDIKEAFKDMVNDDGG